jgi:Bacterial regulatory helix-turn-helix protein, lysR family
VFVKIAELQTVKRGAEAVGSSHPSATQALVDLEQLLDCQLFLRHAQGMTPTPAGIALVPAARKALALVDETATHAREAASFKNWNDMVDRVGGIGPGNAAKFSQAGLTVGGAAFDSAAVPGKATKAVKADNGERSEKANRKPAAAKAEMR